MIKYTVINENTKQQIFYGNTIDLISCLVYHTTNLIKKKDIRKTLNILHTKNKVIYINNYNHIKYTIEKIN